ncbi:hypothetical protein JXA88_02210 [Candidatus Fermentibacteria bacterium]|nr:hypothetical protein [Candidatus Fermentibacteria bacterium]
MKRISLLVDYDTIHDILDQGLTPSLFAQRIVSAASVLGHRGATWCHAEWTNHPASVRDSFETEGWQCGEPLTSTAGWRAMKAQLARDRAMAEDLTVVMVSADRALAGRASDLRQDASEVVLWLAKPQSDKVAGWHRVDSLTRVLGLSEGGVAVVVDVQGLVASSWTVQTSVDVDSLIERLEAALCHLGQVTWRTALADWHTLPVMRNKAGEPITHEAETLFHKAGYSTPLVPPIVPGTTLPDEVAKAMERMSPVSELVVVGRTEVVAQLARLLEPHAGHIHLWCDAQPDLPAWVAWHPIGAELSKPMARVSSSVGSERMPGLWSRIGLFTDRVVAERGGDSIGEGDLVAALVSDATFVRRADQAFALVRAAASRGTLLETGDESRGGKRYRINEGDRGLALMRDIIKALLELLGDGPGEGTGVPVSLVVDGLVSRCTSTEELPQDRRTLQAWLNFLVDEGLLVRFKGASGEDGQPLACLAFSPSPLRGVEVPAPSRGQERGHPRPQKPTPVRVPPRLREHLIVAVDNYAVRHGKPVAPLGAVRKSLAEYGGALIDAAVREAARSGDLQASKGSPGSLALNHQSKFVRLVVARKNKAVAMLKHMAPMGQPIGEARIRSAFVESLRVRDDEAGELLTMLLKDRMLRKEPQIVTSNGLSYTLSMDDPAVVRAHEHTASRPGRGRFGSEANRGSRGKRSRDRRRP